MQRLLPVHRDLVLLDGRAVVNPDQQVAQEQAGRAGSGAIVTLGVRQHRRQPVLVPELEVGLAIGGHGPVSARQGEAIALLRVIDAVLDSPPAAPGDDDDDTPPERPRPPDPRPATAPRRAAPPGPPPP